MAKTEDLMKRIAEAHFAGCRRITCEYKSTTGEDGPKKYVVFVTGPTNKGPHGHSVAHNITTAYNRALTEFEKGTARLAAPVAAPELDEEAESLL